MYPRVLYFKYSFLVHSNQILSTLLLSLGDVLSMRYLQGEISSTFNKLHWLNESRLTWFFQMTLSFSDRITNM